MPKFRVQAQQFKFESPKLELIVAQNHKSLILWYLYFSAISDINIDRETYGRHPHRAAAPVLRTDAGSAQRQQYPLPLRRHRHGCLFGVLHAVTVVPGPSTALS